jgi:hypothetical protein
VREYLLVGVADEGKGMKTQGGEAENMCPQENIDACVKSSSPQKIS